jgi:phage gpG-like protein
VTTGVIIGDKEVAARFQGMPERLRQELRRTVTRLTIELQGYIKSDKLSGQVLNVRTGNLRRNINQRVTETGDSITGVVGTNVEYARLHEYGGTVKEHLRTITMAWGRPLKAPKTIKVPAYTVPARSFLRSALRDRRSIIEGRIAAALHQAVGS